MTNFVSFMWEMNNQNLDQSFIHLDRNPVDQEDLDTERFLFSPNLNLGEEVLQQKVRARRAFEFWIGTEPVHIKDFNFAGMNIAKPVYHIDDVSSLEGEWRKIFDTPSFFGVSAEYGFALFRTRSRFAPAINEVGIGVPTHLGHTSIVPGVVYDNEDAYLIFRRDHPSFFKVLKGKPMDEAKQEVYNLGNRFGHIIDDNFRVIRNTGTYFACVGMCHPQSYILDESGEVKLSELQFKDVEEMIAGSGIGSVSAIESALGTYIYDNPLDFPEADASFIYARQVLTHPSVQNKIISALCKNDMGRYGNEPPSVYPELVEQFVTGFNEGYEKRIR